MGAHVLFDLAFYLLFYSFLGWVIEVAYYAAVQRRFRNRGFTSLPFMLSYGVTFVLLILVLPTVGNRHVFGFLITMATVAVVENLFDQLTRRVAARMQWEWEPERSRLFSGNKKGILLSVLIAAVYYFLYLCLHPLLHTLTQLLPALLLRIPVLILAVLLVLDYATVLYALRTGDTSRYKNRQKKKHWAALAAWLSSTIRKRLHKAYPNIQDMSTEEREAYPFAKGVCLDKLVWVFLIFALVGDIIETLYCGFVDGRWMNRSSVLYGPFSFVWGLGAVMLTITLQRLAGKNDRYVFLAGFVIGGSYEYICSVLTELVFGTVFWDYSKFPLNIGGRTNMLFCFFWGALAVLWVKVLYPPTSQAIERIPVVQGKVLTWVIVFFMVCNGLLTCAVLLRHSTRADQPEPANVFEAFLDRHYDNEYVEGRWPNMISRQPKP